MYVYTYLISYTDKKKGHNLNHCNGFITTSFRFPIASVQKIRVERSDNPDIDVHDKLDHFTAMDHVDERLKDSIKLVYDYAEADIGAVNGTVDKYNKLLKTVKERQRLYKHLEENKKCSNLQLKHHV